MDFPLLAKSDLAGVGYIFWPKKFLKKAKLPEICPSFDGSMLEA